MKIQPQPELGLELEHETREVCADGGDLFKALAEIERLGDTPTSMQVIGLASYRITVRNGPRPPAPSNPNTSKI